jgi:tripartite-type tricarboxylate transporter receptor subunit TctC
VQVTKKSRLLFVLLGTLAAPLLYLSDYGFCQSSFYRGKTIRIVQGSPAGGTGDLRVKATIPFLQKHIPGNPLIVNEYMDGAGGRKAANYLYQLTRSEGLTIGSPGSTFVPSAVLGETGSVTTSTNLPILARTAVKRTTFCLLGRKPDWTL